MTFPAYGKTPRLFRDVMITEKIDGTNGVVSIERGDASTAPFLPVEYGTIVDKPFTGEVYVVRAGSRKRWLDPVNGVDNFGFGAWVRDNAEALAYTLGEGLHYGEWHGLGIQRGYGLTEKRFALFNAHRWKDIDAAGVPGLTVVPTLYIGPFDQAEIDAQVNWLHANGSNITPGFPAEGVIVYHTQSKQVYKVLCENDDKPKSQVA